jgi:hypothetical protein
MALVCKYCGADLKFSAGALQSPNVNKKCSSSPIGTHVALPDPPHCVFCGAETHTSAGKLQAPNTNANCPYSPSGEHQLSE